MARKLSPPEDIIGRLRSHEVSPAGGVSIARVVWRLVVQRVAENTRFKKADESSALTETIIRLAMRFEPCGIGADGVRHHVKQSHLGPTLLGRA